MQVIREASQTSFALVRVVNFKPMIMAGVYYEKRKATIILYSNHHSKLVIRSELEFHDYGYLANTVALFAPPPHP